MTTGDANERQAVTVDMPARFEGAPGTMQGGYLAGVAAAGLTEPVRVQIRKPVRPGDRLTRVEAGGEIQLHRDDGMVMKAFTDRLLIEPPPPITEAEIDKALAHPRPFDLPFPTCVGCGDRDDGLGAVLRPLGHRMVGRWAPTEGAADGRVPPEHVWTVLDCLTSWSVFVDPPADTSGGFVTGNIAARFIRQPLVGVPYRLQAWRVRDVDGGVFRRGSVIVAGTIEDDDGPLVVCDQEMARTDGQGMDLRSVLDQIADR